MINFNKKLQKYLEENDLYLEKKSHLFNGKVVCHKEKGRKKYYDKVGFNPYLGMHCCDPWRDNQIYEIKDGRFVSEDFHSYSYNLIYTMKDLENRFKYITFELYQEPTMPEKIDSLVTLRESFNNLVDYLNYKGV